MKIIYSTNEFSESEIRFYGYKSDVRVDGGVWRDFITKSIECYGDYRFFVTLTYQRALNSMQTMEFSKQVVRDVIKRIVGKHAKQRRKHPPVEGVAVLEMARLSNQTDEGGHIHILLKDHPQLPRDNQDGIDFLRKIFNGASSRLKLANLYGKGRRVVESTRLVNSVTGVHVRLVDDQKKAAGYMSKQSSRSDWDILDRYFYLDDNEGLSIWKPRNSCRP